MQQPRESTPAERAARAARADRALRPPRPAAARSGAGRRNPSVGRRGAPGDDAERGSRPDRGLGGDVVVGRQAVRELLLSGRRRIRDVWLAEGLDPAPIVQEIEELAADARVTVRRASRERLEAEARSDAPQGVLAHAAPLPEADFDALLRARPQGRPPFLLALDGITDPQNLGAVLRSAEGAGVTGVVLPRHRSAHVTPTVTKVAAGAIEWLPIAVVGGLPAALARAKELGAWIVGLDADGDAAIYDLGHLGDQPLVIVVGAEGEGLGRLVQQRCDVLARIPLHGSLASLNAAAAGAIALFELGRHRRAGGSAS